MRKLLLLVLVPILACTQAHSQRITLPSPKAGPGGSTMPSNFYGPNPVGSTADDVDIQAQFVRGEWTRGDVKFKNGLEANNVLLTFDVHNNKLYFKQDGVTMEFTNPVYEFKIGLLIGQDTAKVLYRNSYPAVNANTDETFYEVVVDADIQLLWCRAKNVRMYKDDSESESRRSTDKEQWYVHLPEGKMVKIKKEKDYILKALPQYADRINEIINKNGLRMKDPDDFIALFAKLNGY